VARAGDAHQRIEAEVHSLEPLSGTVLRVRLKPLAKFAYRPGQFVRLITEDGLVRSYSIASTPEVAPLVELHVRLIPGGRMSGRLMDATAPGDRLLVSGPSGGCTYDGIAPDQPLILAGAGTGLAPLWGVLHDALARGHRGPITLYHGALDAAGLYLREELEALAERHANFAYRPCLMDRGEDLLAVVKADPALKGAGVYLCGDAPLVERLRKALFLAGARLADIRADAFAAAA
jgi:ferredoxin-NADP reductase